MDVPGFTLERNMAILAAGALQTAEKVKTAIEIADRVLPEQFKDGIVKAGSKAWKDFWGTGHVTPTSQKPKVVVRYDPLEKASNKLFMKALGNQLRTSTPKGHPLMLTAGPGTAPSGPLRASRPQGSMWAYAPIFKKARAKNKKFYKKLKMRKFKLKQNSLQDPNKTPNEKYIGTALLDLAKERALPQYNVNDKRKV